MIIRLTYRYDPLWPECWRFMRFRTDKENANHQNTYNSIMKSISDNVEKSDLLSHMDKIRTRWKEREKKR